MELGARGYLSKNASAEELLTAVRRVLDGGRYIENEIAQDLGAARRVYDLGMKLDAAHATIASAHGCVRRIIAVGDCGELVGDVLDAIAVGHPDLVVLAFETLEERVVIVDHEYRGTVLTGVGAGAPLSRLASQ